VLQHGGPRTSNGRSVSFLGDQPWIHGCSSCSLLEQYRKCGKFEFGYIFAAILAAARYLDGFLDQHYADASFCPLILRPFCSPSQMGTWKAGTSVINTGIRHPTSIMKNVIPIVMAGGKHRHFVHSYVASHTVLHISGRYLHVWTVYSPFSFAHIVRQQSSESTA
jgi:hypothetical protein